MTSPDGNAEPERRVHGAHLFALRAGPFVLWVVGIFVLVGGAFLDRPGELPAAMIGAGKAIAWPREPFLRPRRLCA